MNDSDPTTVLITGASSGIGLATVDRLHARGYHVFAAVRSKDAAEHLAQRASTRLVPLCLDLDDPGSIARAVIRIGQDLAGRGLDVLVNNAGIMVAGPLECIPSETIRHQFDINVFGHLAVIQATLPLLRAGGGGRIINIGSVSGTVSTPFTGAYNASKAALKALGDALRFELAPWNITVSLIAPGTVHTPMWDRSATNIEALRRNLTPEAESLYGPVFGTMNAFIDSAQQGGQGMSSEGVAEVIERVILAARPRAHYVIGLDARLRLILKWLPTRLRDRVLNAVMRRYPTSERR